MIWGKFPALNSKHSYSVLQACGGSEWNTRHLYLMISIYQQEQSQDVGSDLIPCSPVFTWGTHAHIFSLPFHYHTALILSHQCADNNQQLPNSAVQAVPQFCLTYSTAGTLWLRRRRRWQVFTSWMQILEKPRLENWGWVYCQSILQHVDWGGSNHRPPKITDEALH